MTTNGEFGQPSWPRRYRACSPATRKRGDLSDGLREEFQAPRSARRLIASAHWCPPNPPMQHTGACIWEAAGCSTGGLGAGHRTSLGMVQGNAGWPVGVAGGGAGIGVGAGAGRSSLVAGTANRGFADFSKPSAFSRWLDRGR
ncbi:hypothetical protein AK830_g11244 [Neonectria ditissima]|uniref:Uncharacterized protein n=1 Tax=Neonectria ditissima TaxID=78410 RepID=A0A0P7AMY8_9HYPO|nr:hypothetical protein AK830_g11244 [Neonectria ditissima]